MTRELDTGSSEYHRRVAAMFADQDLTGDLLLIGLYLADRWRVEAGDVQVQEIADAVFPRLPPLTVTINGVSHRRRSPGESRVDKALRGDIRRYSALVAADVSKARYRCQAPMQRRPRPCGGNDSRVGFVTDVATGARLLLVACTRHLGWWEQQRKTHQAAVADAGSTIPAPPANCGGILARHFPEVDWPAYWTRLDPRWVPSPEPGDDPRPTVAPTLRLVTTKRPSRTARHRPQLQLIEGG